jgi:hypothetical protein
MAMKDGRFYKGDRVFFPDMDNRFPDRWKVTAGVVASGRTDHRTGDKAGLSTYHVEVEDWRKKVRVTPDAGLYATEAEATVRLSFLLEREAEKAEAKARELRGLALRLLTMRMASQVGEL